MDAAVAVPCGLPLTAGDFFFTTFFFVVTIVKLLWPAENISHFELNRCIASNRECANVANEIKYATKIFVNLWVFQSMSRNVPFHCV